MLRRTLPLLVLVLWMNTAIYPQQSESFTVVAALKVKPGMEGTFMNLVKKYDQPVFTRLIEEGTVLAWGVDAAALHHQGEPNYYLWWTIPTYAAQDKVVAAMEEVEKKMKSDDDMRAAEAKRLKQSAPKAAMQEFFEAVDFEMHHDFIFRNLVSNVQSVPAGTLPYTWISRFKVERGKGQDYRKLWEKYDKPIWDKMVADGVIFGYGLAVEDFNSQGSGLRWFWVISRDHSAADKVDAAFGADRDRRSEEERSAINRQFREVLDPSGDHDDLYRAAIYGSK